MNLILNKYAQLLVNYCLGVKEGERLFIKTTLLGEPLLKEVYREALKKGAHIETSFEFRDQAHLFFEEASEKQLQYIQPCYEKAMRESDCYLFIRAPYNLRDEQNISPDKRKIHKIAQEKINSIYFKRTGNGSLRRSLCQFPTDAAAQEANMSLSEYEKFVYNACHLFSENPTEKWLEMRAMQQKIVDFLDTKDKIHYKNEGTDLTFHVKNRKWINSDGRANMPSGEVFTSPIENKVNGVIHFSYPAVYMGNVVEGVTLWVKDGYVTRWEAKQGGSFLEQMLEMKGARRFGEVAIGTNYNIQQYTKNVLFDEKIGGTVHLALGQSYIQTGGKNQSPIHWDLVTSMHQGGEIFADGEKIYENGKFLIL